MAKCTFYHCVLGLIDRKATLSGQDSDEQLTKSEKNHLLRSHSQVPVRSRNTLLGVGVVFERCASNGMAFYCHCKKRYWTRDGLAKHYREHCSQTDIPPKIAGLKLVDASEVTNEDLTLINTAAGSDDEVGEDDEPIESLPQLEGIVGHPATNLTAGDFFKALTMVLNEQRNSETRVLQSMAGMKSEILNVVTPGLPQNGPTSKKRAIGAVTNRDVFKPFKNP
ncbi:hypothetical protein BG005_003280, partial [Podila minutissima]